jgi:SAM-dependent methyltransferase
VDARFAYDAVEYRSGALPHCHPDRLFVVGSLFGLSPCPAERCRYLEFGCGDGTHLIACALTLPQARFVGVDLSGAAVERGRAVIAELGLENISLQHADLTAWEPEEGAFDYVVGHGVYSWVPPAVRDRLLAHCRRGLAPDGIAYVSYNAYPGGYFRRALWDMLKFHTRSAVEPGQKIAGAREFLEFFIEGVSRFEDGYSVAAAAEAKATANPDDTHMLYHDDLSEVNDPVYFHQFVEHAAAHGLKFVAESDVPAMRTTGFPPRVAGILAGLRRSDPLLKEQYLDFLKFRRFRHTLLCHHSHAPAAEPSAAVIPRLAVSVTGHRPEGEVDLDAGTEMTFQTAAGLRTRVDKPLPKAVLTVVYDRSPERIPFDELVRDVAGLLAPGDPGSVRPQEVASVVLDAFAAGFVELHGHRPSVALIPGERPIANPLARIQARHGYSITTSLHTTIRLDGDASRALVRMMDGTRDRAALAAEMRELMPPEEVEAGLDQSLAWLARAGLFVA